MQNPDSSRKPAPPPETSALFAANQSANQRSMAPAADLPIVASYKPSGRVGVLTFPLALLSLALVPLLASWIYVHAWYFGNWLLFSDIAFGLFTGALLFPAVHLGKMRNPLVAGILGVLIGATTFLAAMGWEAWQSRPAYIAGESTYIAKKYHMTPQKALAAAEKFYTPANTIQFFWQDRAQYGVTISSSDYGSPTTGSQLSGTAFWALQGFELLLVMAMAALVAGHFAGRRFSEESNRWFITHSFGVIHPLHLNPMLAALEAGDYRGAAQVKFTSKKENQHGPQVSLAYLPDQPGAILSVRARTSKGMKTVFERQLSNAETKAFWPAFQNPSAPDSPFSS